jgi:hypothetical protein
VVFRHASGRSKGHAMTGPTIGQQLDATLANLATKQDLERFATKEDLERFATKEDLKNFATKEDLKNFVTKEDIKNFATRDESYTSTIPSFFPMLFQWFSA